MRVDKWLTRLQHPQNIHMGLDRAKSVAEKLGIEKIATHTITVAGTNGKGSCCAIIDSLARSHGLRTAVYTSPHLLHFNERLRLCGQEVSDEKLLNAFEEVENTRDHVELTYFEFTTLAIFHIIAKSQVDLAILEVGLGGRLDAVNIIDADCSVITSIANDHEAFLGKDLTNIFKEKAGIARSEMPLVIGAGIEVNVNKALECDAQVSFINKSDSGYFVSKKQRAVQKFPPFNSWSYQDDNILFENLPRPALSGDYQVANAACSIAALKQVCPLNKEDTVEGLQQITLNGRLQILSMPNKKLLVDVGHNPQAVTELAHHVQENFKKIDVIFSSFADKDIEGNILKIKPIVQHWYIYQLEDTSSGFRNAGLDIIHDVLINSGIHESNITTGENFDALWFKALNKNSPFPLLAFGSFMVVKDALTLQQKYLTEQSSE